MIFHLLMPEGIPWAGLRLVWQAASGICLGLVARQRHLAGSSGLLPPASEETLPAHEMA